MAVTCPRQASKGSGGPKLWDPTSSDPHSKGPELWYLFSETSSFALPGRAFSEEDAISATMSSTKVLLLGLGFNMFKDV